MKWGQGDSGSFKETCRDETVWCVDAPTVEQLSAIPLCVYVPHLPFPFVGRWTLTSVDVAAIRWLLYTVLL